MRRPMAVRTDRRGLVAIYDALLFLMVVVLISVGMFLYTARSASEEGDFSPELYQKRADNQLAMYEALEIADPSRATVEWDRGNRTETVPVSNLTDVPGAPTVSWLLESYCELRLLNETPGTDMAGNLSFDHLLGLVNGVFENETTWLGGTHYLWMFTYNDETVYQRSDNVTSAEHLPDDRWAAVSDYSGSTNTIPKINYTAELRYFLWLA